MYNNSARDRDYEFPKECRENIKQRSNDTCEFVDENGGCDEKNNLYFAHIVSKKWKRQYNLRIHGTSFVFNDENNCIHLCDTHHLLIDGENGEYYTEEMLHEMIKKKSVWYYFGPWGKLGMISGIFLVLLNFPRQVIGI
jgi:hypothetical protein